MLVTLLLLSSAAFADAADMGKSLSVRTFAFKHKQAENAAAVIKSLMSADGTMSIQPKTNSLVVTDDPANLKRIAAALAEFDTAPQAFKLSVRLLLAKRNPAAKQAHLGAELAEVEKQLTLLRYTEIADAGAAEAAGSEGSPSMVDLSQYRANFKFGQYDAASDTIEVSDFQLSKLDGDQLAPLMKTTLNLKIGQTVVMGVTRDASSQRALMLVLSAKR
ncbi:MAG TPA: secretin N-terminal domain-containing protein [Thermoanaerobaculia bacterium]|nr:secretin N-terminal domain-containing protein [Thermoanaerobaculia bacterium]